MSDRFDSECFNSATTSLENSLLGISNCRPDSHVAQQSRRDKLRIQQSSSQGHHRTQDSSQHLVQVPRDTGGLNPDLVQVRNVRNCGDLLYDPTIFSSEMLNFSTTNTHSSLAHKHGMLHEESGPDRPGKPVGAEVSSFANSSYPNPSNSNPLVKAGDTHNPMIWKGFGSQQICDWIVNYVNGPVINACSTQSPSQAGGVLSGTVNENKSSAYAHYPKPGFSGYQDVQSSLTNPSSELSSQDCHKQYESMQCSSSFYQNTLHEVVAPSSNVLQSQGSEMASLVQQNINRETSSWMDGANELVLLPVYENQANPSRLNSAGAWAAQRPLDGSNQWNSNLGFAENKIGGDLRTVASDSSSHQALSLSLSSHRSSELHAAQFGERFGSGISQSRTGISSGSQDFKSNNSGYLCSSFKSSIGNKGYYRDSMGGVVSLSTYERRSTGPLGPFTGYATILKNSKFLKPAQKLLDEFCSVTGPKLNKICEMSEKRLGDVSTSCDTGNAGNEVSVRGGNSGASTSFYGSTEASGEGGVGNGSYDQSHHPEFQQRKAKLLYMQEEVSRRYKQYQQQMQMVVSSFESVAGLSAATPYTSLALKTISKHFRCLKIAISDQLTHITKILGEDMSSATTGTSSSKGDTMTPRLKFVDQYFRKQKLNGDSLGFLEPQQHVWRPQRGLPERSVAILRAWLFEHFLHPYPTDADKQMLATQTGLTRNQVSNWFINARVRVWKPMVEEIHMLETKGSAVMDLNTSKNESWAAFSNDDSAPPGDQPNNKLMVEPMSEKRPVCLGIGPVLNTDDGRNLPHWNQGKQSRMHCQLPAGMDNGLIGFVPYHQSGLLDMGGLGAVSLTLGLRHTVDDAQQQLQQQEECHLKRHFGGQMIHNFGG